MQITRVRLLPAQANEALEKFVFGGHYGPMRPPRGIAPPQVSEFVKRRAILEGDADDLAKTMELVRFYERKDVVEPMLRLLTPAPSTPEEFRKQAIVCQIAGDFGEPAEIQKAVQHVDNRLLGSLVVVQEVPYVFAALLALAPAGSLDPIEKCLKEEQKRLAPLQRKSDQDLMAYDRVTAFLRNDLERTRSLIAAKKKYLALKPDEGTPILVKLYLSREGPPDPYLQVWAARRVRGWALETSPEPARNEFR
ncbi:MAG TPA: hypothetical protein VGR78_04725, partial [Verrucomicrobiae bacterium]|nr:hypothetical protein [Verrucomicrobiae bacterium]